MPGQRPPRMVGAVLRCYPRRWRRRHGEEAAELAALLMRDGVPARSVACSYLGGAAREWLTLKPGRRLAAATAALLAAAGVVVGAPLGLLSASVSASAASAARGRDGSAADPAARLAAQLACGALHGQTVRAAQPALERWHVKIVWAAPGRAASRMAPPGWFHLAGGYRVAPDVISIRVAAQRPVADGHDRRC